MLPSSTLSGSSCYRNEHTGGVQAEAGLCRVRGSQGGRQKDGTGSGGKANVPSLEDRLPASPDKFRKLLPATVFQAAPGDGRPIPRRGTAFRFRA